MYKIYHTNLNSNSTIITITIINIINSKQIAVDIV